MKIKAKGFLRSMILIILWSWNGSAQTPAAVGGAGPTDPKMVTGPTASSDANGTAALAEATEAAGPEKCLNCLESPPLEPNKNLLDLTETTARLADPCLQFGSAEERAQMTEKWVKAHPDEQTRTIDACVSTGVGDTLVGFGDSISAIGNMIRDPEERAAAMSAIGDFMSLMASHPVDTGKAYLASYAAEKKEVFQAIQKCLSGEEAVRATCGFLTNTAVNLVMALNAVKSVVGSGVKKVLTAKAAKGLKEEAAAMGQLGVRVGRLSDDRSVVQMAQELSQMKLKKVPMSQLKEQVGLGASSSNADFLEHLKKLSGDLQKNQFSAGAQASVKMMKKNLQILNSRVMSELVEKNDLIKAAFSGKQSLLKRVTSGKAGSSEVAEFEKVVRQSLADSLKKHKILETDSLDEVMAKLGVSYPGEIKLRAEKLQKELALSPRNPDLQTYKDQLQDGYSYASMTSDKYRRMLKEKIKKIDAQAGLSEAEKKTAKIQAVRELHQQTAGRLNWAGQDGAVDSAKIQGGPLEGATVGGPSQGPILSKLESSSWTVEDLQQIEKSLDQTVARQSQSGALKFWDRRMNVKDLDQIKYLAGVPASTENLSEILAGMNRTRRGFSQFPQGEAGRAQLYLQNKASFTRIDQKLRQVQAGLEKTLEAQLKAFQPSKEGLLSLKVLKGPRGESAAMTYVRIREIPREMGLVDEAGFATDLAVSGQVDAILAKFRSVYPSQAKNKQELLTELQNFRRAFDPEKNLEADDVYNATVQIKMSELIKSLGENQN